MTATVEPVEAPAGPEWAQELSARLAVDAQLVLTGNIADLHVATCPGEPARLQPTAEVVRSRLVEAGFAVLLAWHAVTGIEVLHEQEPGAAEALLAGEPWNGRRDRPTAAGLAELLRRVVGAQERTAVVVEGAPRLAPDPGQDPEVHRLHVVAAHLARTAGRRIAPGGRRRSLFNTVVWLVDRESDLPHWLLGGPGLRVINVPEPTLETRRRAAGTIVAGLPGVAGCDRDAVAARLAAETEGLPLAALASVQRLSVDRGIPAAEVDDAVRFLRSGLRTSPWRDPGTRSRIAAAADVLAERVIGQPVAVRSAADILHRASLGLTGAHSQGHPGRPQGVMFLAGPTGTGKTELAKQIAGLVFGREEAMIRFDMSEFSAEHTQARLLGAPPGYVGHEAGGELTNAVRNRPFSLLLFDEIEKADPRILDKFLQVLEDGRLTDGAGSTVHFGETLIVFTSNLGVLRPDGRGGLEPLPYGTPYEQLAGTVKASIRHEFVTVIKRPELLNRIGENIIVFGYISAEAAAEIARRGLANLARNVRARTGIEVVFTEPLLAELTAVVSRPECLLNGGRGVGSVIESRVVNPLARQLLQRDPGRVLVTGCGYDERHGHRLTLEWA